MSKNIIARIAQWLANELIVKGLANNPSFQRFAQRTHARTQEIANKAVKTSQELAQNESLHALRNEAQSKANEVKNTAVGLAELLKDNLKKALEDGPKSKNSNSHHFRGPPKT
mmetsp:Transcript_9736/g.20514  ORF Transcript_9736/g.20514 Transcript_9736/m.20514 type:complete len:113 (-) Transcript_9736:5-343(-)